MKLIYIIFVAYTLNISVVKCDEGSITSCEDACNIRVKCSNEEMVVWASDGETCLVFRNNCYLMNWNCQLQNSCKDVLRDIGKNACQKLCPDICPFNYDPVCGYYNDNMRTFSNRCVMDSYICRSGETWNTFTNEACRQTEP